METDPAIRRDLDLLVAIVNSLYGQGFIVQTGISAYALKAGDRFTAARKPTAFDDSTRGASVGSLWVNTATSKFYVCVSAAAGAALWNGPY